MKLLIGIDPDKGFAIWSPVEMRLIEVMTVNFWKIIDNLIQCKKNHEIEVYIETPQDISPVWHRHNKARIQETISQHVGENKAKSKLLIEYMKLNDIYFHECKPTARSMTGLKRENFEAITGWTKQTSEHGRDAAMLVYGRKY